MVWLFLQSSACSLPQPHLSEVFFLLLLFSNCLSGFSLSCLSRLFPPLLFFCCVSRTFLHNVFHLFSSVWSPGSHTTSPQPPQKRNTTTYTDTLIQPGTYRSNKSCSLWIPRPFQVWWEHTWTPRATRMARWPHPPNPLSSRSPPPQVTHPEELNTWDLAFAGRVLSCRPHRVT